LLPRTYRISISRYATKQKRINIGKIIFLFTGGPIDSYCDIAECEAMCCDKSIIHEYFKKIFLDRYDDSEYI